MRGLFTRLVFCVVTAFAALAVVAAAHVYTQFGGGGDDVLSGHEHVDYLYGNAGCDELLGHDSADHLEGGPSGCDKVRGMEGSGDDVIVWDDDKGNDEAYGGSGGSDVCKVGNLDFADILTCETIRTP